MYAQVGCMQTSAAARQNVVHPQNECLAEQLDSNDSDKILAMIVSLRHLLGWMVSAFSSRKDFLLENLALRQQLLALGARTTVVMAWKHGCFGYERLRT